MYSQEKQFSSLAKILSNYDRVIIDTCALMDEGFPQFMDQLVGSKRYWKKGLLVIVPEECIEELKKHAENNDWHYSDARIDAVRALNILKDAKRKHQVIQTAKRQQRKGDTFADPSILATAAVLRIHYRILVITQDKDLAYDLEGLNSLGSQSGRSLATMRINAGGQLEGLSLNRQKPKDSKKIETKYEKKQADKKSAKETKTTEKPSVIAQIEQKPTPKPVPKAKKEEKPADVKAPRPFYEYGATPVDAIVSSAKHQHVLVRDPSIPYVKEVHGPSDITRDVLLKNIDVTKLVNPGDKINLSIEGLGIVIEKTERDFKATVSLEPAKIEEPKKPAINKVEKPVEAKVEKEKPAPKNAPSSAKNAKEAKPKEEKAVLKAASEVKTEKPAPKKAAPKKTPLEKAIIADKRLNSNIANPNYPTEKKIKDIDSFIKLYDKLNEEERKQIKLTKEFLLAQKETLK